MVNEESVSRIIGLTNSLKAIRYMPSRKKALAEVIEVMPDEDKWLLSFCTWQCLFNTRSKAVDPEKLCLPEPAEENKIEFTDFLNFLRKHNNVRFSPSRLKPLIQLLSNCNVTRRDFYLSLLTKQWIEGMPVVELQALLSLDDFTCEKVYGELEFLRTAFSELQYPVAVRRVSTKKLRPYLMVKEPMSTMYFVDKGEGYKRVQKDDKVSLDLKLSSTPRFTVAGFCDSDTFYPTDYFSSWEDCTNFLNGFGTKHDFVDRFYYLDIFLESNMMVHTDTSPCAYARNESELVSGILQLAQEDITGLLIYDSYTTLTRKPYRVTCRIASGVIESVSQDSVSLWFNGELINCSYSFSGKEQALLSCPEVLKNKTMEFYFIQIGNTEYCFGKGICWNKPRWREKRLRESGAWVDKCALCGSTKHRHSNRGVCKSCEANLNYYYNTYGVDVWITPSVQMDAKRYKAVWKHSILNLVGYKYKGTTLEAREDGSWRFKQGEDDG